MRRLVFVLSVMGATACSSESWGPVSYHGRSTAQPGLDLWIDGEIRNEVSYSYADPASLAAAKIVYELRDGAEVIDSLEVAVEPAVADCLQFGEAPFEMDDFVFSFPHGELRRGGYQIDRCAIAEPAYSVCGPDYTCLGDTRCVSSFHDTALRWSHQACAPIGTGALDEACAYHAGSDGRYVDDCGDNLLCVDGVCRQRCVSGACGGGFTCSVRAGHALGACFP